MRFLIAAAICAAAALAGGATLASSAAPPKNPASVLNGVYRVTHTQKELLADGVSPQEAHDNYGVFTLKLKDGRYQQRLVNYVADGCNGTYRVSGTTFTIDLNVPHCKGFVVAKWTLRNEELRLRVLKSQYLTDKVLLGSKPWKKIG